MRRAVLTSLSLAHAVVVTGLVVAVGWTHHKPRPCRTTFEQVHVGMTREEVEATVGGPPGDYTTPGSDSMEDLRVRFVGGEQWEGDGAELDVVFSADGRAERMEVRTIRRRYPPSAWERTVPWAKISLKPEKLANFDD